MRNFFTAILLLAACCLATVAQTHYVGGDISLLPEYEKAGSQYLDHDGKVIPDLIPWLKEQGMNAMRVRLFVNPSKYKELHANDTNGDTKYDPNACQDLEYIKPICKRIVESGMDLMLDFHYSDTWADPAKQWTPIDWEGLTDEQLYVKIYDYTKEVLTELKGEGIVPAFIQPGNEISYGMLWGPLGTNNPKKALMGSNANWDRFATLLKQTIKACNEVCPDAKIILHTERVSNVGVQNNFYDKMKQLGVPYDIIGLSYYPYFHGKMSVLNTALASLSARYDKNIMIVETGYPLHWQVPGSTVDNTSTWPLNDAGQAKFVTDLLDTVKQYDKVDGLFWWWLEYNPYRGGLSNWYNAPLFDPNTGRATSALTELCGFATSGINEVIDDSMESDTYYNMQGIPVERPSAPGIYVRGGHKVIIK